MTQGTPLRSGVSDMTDEQKFFVYLLECYACEKGRLTGEVLKEWDEHGITQYVLDNYLQYHTEAIENAYTDIDSMLETGKPAW